MNIHQFNYNTAISRAQPHCLEACRKPKTGHKVASTLAINIASTTQNMLIGQYMYTEVTHKIHFFYNHYFNKSVQSSKSTIIPISTDQAQLCSYVV